MSVAYSTCAGPLGRRERGQASNHDSDHGQPRATSETLQRICYKPPTVPGTIADAADTPPSKRRTNERANPTVWHGRRNGLLSWRTETCGYAIRWRHRHQHEIPWRLHDSRRDWGQSLGPDGSMGVPGRHRRATARGRAYHVPWARIRLKPGPTSRTPAAGMTNGDQRHHRNVHEPGGPDD
jgi:hypothetical protein